MAKTHGDSGTRLYIIWQDMRARCDGRAGRWANRYYHERGIRVCEEWQAYPVFKEWALASGYASDLQIDRIDNAGDYTPENCRWVTRCQQMQNTRVYARKNKTSKYRGVSKQPSGKWHATGYKGGRRKHLGVFLHEDDAARAYDAWAREHYGEFANPNFKK